MWTEREGVGEVSESEMAMDGVPFDVLFRLPKRTSLLNRLDIRWLGRAHGPRFYRRQHVYMHAGIRCSQVINQNAFLRPAGSLSPKACDFVS